MDETTASVLAQVMATLRRDIKESGGAAPNSSHVPVFDRNIDYVAKVRHQSEILHQMQSLHEDHSADYLVVFKRVMQSQKRLKSKIAKNEERLSRKREEKLNRKELERFQSIHSLQLNYFQTPTQINGGHVLSLLQPYAAAVPLPDLHSAPRANIVKFETDVQTE